MGALRGLRRIWRVILETYDRFSSDDGEALAGYMAFSMFLSLFPFLIFVTAMAALAIGMQDVDATLAFMFDALPPDVAGVLEPVVSDTVHARVSGAPLTLSLVGALWVASNGIEALRAALNRAYSQAENRSWIYRRLQSVGLVFAASLAFVFLTVLVPLWPSLVDLLTAPLQLLQELPVKAFVREMADLPYLTLMRYGLAALVLGIAIYAAHRILPSGDPEAPVWPGVIFTILCWLAGGALFSVYLAYIPSYSLTYGALGGVIVALFFFYISAAIVILGAELNAVLGGLRRDPESRRRQASQTADQTAGSSSATPDGAGRIEETT
ncbi:YihY/virulence factor BrkB family protein [Neomegalonema perideroedes]|uniref:YihY/virulence factor BrkB family protein n=1 Tax=Neomegalonema perideroedes TaxID=217219 RepID=UPI00035DBD34|nr:YihY/virulence factor BrkB family protein [Neomegalonema perideroedes]